MWQKFPSLQNGFDRKTFLLARYSYYEDISINWHRYQLPAEVNKKLGIAEEYAKQEIINRFQKMETEKIEEWAREYICWMNQRGIHKYTKASIKAFFETKKLKVSTLTIDTIKAKL